MWGGILLLEGLSFDNLKEKKKDTHNEKGVSENINIYIHI